MFQQEPFMGLDEEIATMIETHGLFCCHPDEAYPKLVREFYSYISTDSPFVMCVVFLFCLMQKRSMIISISTS